MGYPWDERIHSRTKSKIADGTWKLMRGVDPDTVTDVRAETTPGYAPNRTAPPPPPPLVKPDDTVAPASGVTPASLASSATPTPTDGQPLTWLQTVQRSTKGIAEKRYNQEAVGAFLKETFGVPSVGGLNGKPDELAAFNLWLDSLDAEAGA
jgi:hypothetical protein